MPDNSPQQSSLMSWTSNLQQPKAVDRFEVFFPDNIPGSSNKDALRLACHTVQLPSRDFSQVRIDRMHNRYFVAGAKNNWSETVSMTFYDFVDNQSATALNDWQEAIYNSQKTTMGFPADYKRDLLVFLYAPDGTEVEVWSLIGAWPKDISRSQLAWKDGDGITEVTINFSIDMAKLVLTKNKAH